MKPGIHPQYRTARITCACGAVHDTRSTGGDMRVDVCSSCHPAYTGERRVIDTTGRIDRFRRRYAAGPAPVRS